MKNYKSLCVMVLLCLLVGVAYAQDGALGELYTSEVVACPDFAAALNNVVPSQLDADSEVEGETYECGIIYVPENHDNPEGRVIELLYLRLFSTSLAPEPDPVFHLAGGPGSSGTIEMSIGAAIYRNYQFIRQRRDIIAYDQRGTGYSDYLVCAPFDTAYAVLEERIAAPELTEALAQLEAQPAFLLPSTRCGVAYAATGTDLSFYNSVSSAQDIAVLADALGYDGQYNLIGTSYGTRLAQTAMRQTPDRVRSVVLDGVIVADVSNIVTTINKRADAYQTVFDACAADSACNAAYPNLEARFGALLAQLAENPIPVDPPILVAPIFVNDGWIGEPNTQPVLSEIGTDFFVQLPTAMDSPYALGGISGVVPALIQAVEDGDIEFVREFISMGIEPQQPTSPVQPSNVPTIPPSRPEFAIPLNFLLAQAQASISAESLSNRWINLVLVDLLDRLTNGEDQAEVIADLIEFSLLPAGRTSAENLNAFTDANLLPGDAFIARELVSQMSRDDLFQTRWSIQDIAFKLGAPDVRQSSSLYQYANNCSEDTAFQTVEDVAAYRETVPYPQLDFIELTSYAFVFFAPCELFPPSILDESFFGEFDSEIPALVINGGVDIATPIGFARTVPDYLENSFVVEFENIGHVVTSLDPTGCSGSIAAAFYDDPSSEPNISCTESAVFDFEFEIVE